MRSSDATPARTDSGRSSLQRRAALGGVAAPAGHLLSLPRFAVDRFARHARR